MDFDIYQFHRSDTEMKLEEFTKKSAADFNGSDAQTKMINGIEVGTFLSREVYEGVEYDVMTALIEDGSDYIEVVFWLDGEIAVRQARPYCIHAAAYGLMQNESQKKPPSSTTVRFS